MNVLYLRERARVFGDLSTEPEGNPDFHGRLRRLLRERRGAGRGTAGPTLPRSGLYSSACGSACLLALTGARSPCCSKYRKYSRLGWRRVRGAWSDLRAGKWCCIPYPRVRRQGPVAVRVSVCSRVAVTPTAMRRQWLAAVRSAEGQVGFDVAVGGGSSLLVDGRRLQSRVRDRLLCPGRGGVRVAGCGSGGEDERAWPTMRCTAMSRCASPSVNGPSSLAGGPRNAIARGYVPTKLSVAVVRKRGGLVWPGSLVPRGGRALDTELGSRTMAQWQVGGV